MNLLYEGEEVSEFVFLRYILKLENSWKLIVQHFGFIGSFILKNFGLQLIKK